MQKISLSINRYRGTVLLVCLYGCAALQFIRFYVRNATFYLDMPRYLAGQERLPFQERVFPILFLKPLTESVWVQTHLAHSTGIFTAERGPFYLLSLIAFVVAAVYTQRLYQALTIYGSLRALVFPLFLGTAIFTYVIHSEANFAYPYDMPSLAFFSAGLFYIFKRRFVPLLLILLVGTFNRETTIFLIVIYMLDAASSSASDRLSNHGELRSRFDLSLIPWQRAALLAAIWLAVKLSLIHHFAGNNQSESFLRVHDNFQQLRPRLLPALLNLCGYTLPMVVIFRGRLAPERFRNYLWVLPLWFGVMFCSGVLLETRIYGELCPLAAVASVLIMERTAALRMGVVQPEDSLESRPEEAALSVDRDVLAPAA